MTKKLFISGLALVFLLSACGSSAKDSHTTSTTTASTTTIAPGTPTTAATSTTAAATATSAASGSNKCVAAQLTATEVRTDAGAGQRYATIGLANSASTPCTMNGYPGLAVDSAKGVFVSTVSREPGTVSTVTLAKGVTGYFDVHYSPIPSGNDDCEAATSFRITPPNDTTQVPLPVTDVTSLCKTTGVSVTPVRATSSR